MTVAKESRFYILNPDRLYRVCDRLDVIIEARDGNRKPKTTGGDYFRARIYNDALKAGESPDGSMEYIGEGRYKVRCLSSFHLLRTYSFC